jgi:DNA polymerase
MTRRAHVDFETASDQELGGQKSVGVHRYAESPHTRVWGFSWGFSKYDVHRWRPGYPDPTELLEHIAAGGIVVAHNAGFERIIWAFIRARYGLGHWPALCIWQQDCTLARAANQNLPIALEKIGRILKLREKKDDEGAKLMKSMSKPKILKDGTITWPLDTPQNRDRLELYQDQDVRTEIEGDDILLPLPPLERDVWELDQVINDRGIPVDIEAVTVAWDVVNYAKRAADRRMFALTGGAVGTCNEIENIVNWIRSRGFKCDSFRKDDHADIMMFADFGGDEVVRKVVELRRDAGKTSTSKFLRILECVCADDRIRGQIMYCGATQTKRFAGKLVQTQNLKRFDPEREADGIKFAINLLKSGMTIPDIYNVMSMAFKAPIDVLAKCMRPMIKAEDGHVFYNADYSNVEGRINAWLANETTKIAAFLAYDNKTGPDLYKLAFSGAFGKPVEQVAYEERQVGKVMELSFGFQGGVGAFIENAEKAQPPLKPAAIVAPVRAAVAADMWFRVREEYQSATDKFDLLQDEWTAVKIVVRGWRNNNAMIKQGWYDAQDAAIQAMDAPYTEVPCYFGRVSYLFDGSNLYCRLPDGSILYYNQAFMRYQVTEYVEVAGAWIDCTEFFPHELEDLRKAGARFKQQGRNVVYFHHEVTGQWVPQALYGGLQCENIVQGTGRAILVRAMLRVEKAGYPIVMHTHDDILSHVRKGFGSVAEYEDLMRINEPWLAGMPLAVKGHMDERYGFK